jgi:hypothetical protein
MAQRRMFSKSITNSSQFLMMPDSSQSLYFHLGMNADDDGYCEHFSIMRMTGSKPDDLKILHAKGFVHVYDEKVLVIIDWKENNYLRADRYTPSKYLSIYTEEMRKIPSGIPAVATGKDRLGKDRLENNMGLDSENTEPRPDEEELHSDHLTPEPIKTPSIADGSPAPKSVDTFMDNGKIITGSELLKLHEKAVRKTRNDIDGGESVSNRLQRPMVKAGKGVQKVSKAKKLTPEQKEIWDYARKVFSEGYEKMNGIPLDFSANGKAFTRIAKTFAGKREFLEDVLVYFHKQVAKREQGYDKLTFSPNCFGFALDKLMAKLGGMSVEESDKYKYGTAEEKKKIFDDKINLNTGAI